MYSGARNNDMDKITLSDKSFGSVYLGNIRAAEDAPSLQRNNIRAVLSVIDTSVVNVDRAVSRKWIVAEDYEGFNLYDYFEEAISFIDDQTRYTNVLVHCYAGISRSATLVAAYLMKKNNLSLKQALSQLNQNRPIINPNPGFMQQLRRYEQDLNQKKITVAQKENQALTESRFSTSSILSQSRASLTTSQSRMSVPNHQPKSSVPQTPIRNQPKDNNFYSPFHSIYSPLKTEIYQSNSSVPHTPSKNQSQDAIYQPFASIYTPIKSVIKQRQVRSFLPPQVLQMDDQTNKSSFYRSSDSQTFSRPSETFTRRESVLSAQSSPITQTTRNQKLASLQQSISLLGVGDKFKVELDSRMIYKKR